jgi:hypothetical protein
MQHRIHQIINDVDTFKTCFKDIPEGMSRLIALFYLSLFYTLNSKGGEKMSRKKLLIWKWTISCFDILFGR